MALLIHLTRSIVICSIASGLAVSAHGKLSEAETIAQVDFDGDGMLDWVEVTAGLENRLDTAAGRKPKINLAALKKQKSVTLADLGKLDPKMPIAQDSFKNRFGPGPRYSIAQLVADPYFSPKLFALNQEESPGAKPDVTSRWVTGDKHPLKIRRSIEDLNTAEGPDAAAKDSSTKGALVSYTSNFNSNVDQWAFHGIVGWNLVEKNNVHFGQDEQGRRPPVDPNTDAGITAFWLRPSIALDKVTTSQSSKDEVDSLIARLGAGFRYSGKNLTNGLVDGFNLNVAPSYATDTSGDRKVFGGELDITPERLGSDLWNSLNSAFRPLWIFRIRPELVFHAEGGSVLDDAGIAALARTNDFFRVGGTFGLSIRFTEAAFVHVPPLERLLLHAGLQYYVDVVGDGPDVNLFCASADWALDDSGRYSLTTQYRNGRAPLLLQRDHSITVGLSVKF